MPGRVSVWWPKGSLQSVVGRATVGMVGASHCQITIAIGVATHGQAPRPYRWPFSRKISKNARSQVWATNNGVPSRT